MAAGKLALVGLKHELFFYTPGVTARQIGCLGERYYTSTAEAIAAVLAGLPEDATVAAVPEGPYVYARLG